MARPEPGGGRAPRATNAPMPEQLDYATISEIFRRFHAAEPEPRGELAHTNAYTLLVAVALSAQATDRGVNRATEALFRLADTPAEDARARRGGADRAHQDHRALQQQGPARDEALAHPRRATSAARCPPRAPRCRACPGVGRKTANVVLNTWFRLPAMAVDTHIFRVANRTGIAPGRDVARGRAGARGPGAGALPAARPPLADPARPLRLRRAQAALPRLPDPRPLRLRGEEPVTKAYQVVGIGNALVDVICPRRGRLPRRERRREGHHAADRHRPRGRALRPHGAGARDLRRLGGQHHRRARRARRPHRLRRQGQGRPARRDLRPRPARPGRGLRDAAGAARPSRTRPAAAWSSSAATASAR